MNGVEVKKTYPADFEKIYPILQNFNSPYSKEDWKKIFLYSWDGAEDYVGFHLENKSEVVGFMGLIFSCRNKDNAQYKFCNITSLIVKDNYRAATILLIRKLKSFNDTIFTGLSPILESYRLLSIVGFTPYENYYKIIPTITYLFGKKNKVNIYELPMLLDKVDAENKRIVIDHANLKCNSILFDFDGHYCLLIYKITKQNHYYMPVKKVHILYISNLTLFNEKKSSILRIFNRRFGFLTAMYIDNRFLTEKNFILSLTRKISPPRISFNPYHQVDIDELYSEAVLL